MASEFMWRRFNLLVLFGSLTCHYSILCFEVLYKISVSIYIFCSFLVIESHPDNALEDLRLDQPFPELKDHIKSYDLDNMDKKVCSSICSIFLMLF